MRCPFCSSDNTRVIDSRLADLGESVRRRRECQTCEERFTTFERAELKLPPVIKSDGRREPFDETKLRRGMRRALEKRPVDTEAMESAINRIMRRIAGTGEREVAGKVVGEAVMEELRQLDEVAFIRFASVYRQFQDPDAFSAEVRRLRNKPEETKTERQLSLLPSEES